MKTTELPVSLVQNDDLMPSRGQRHFLLRESLDFISNDIDSSLNLHQPFSKTGKTQIRAPFIRRVQFQHALFVRISQ
jgi:hypothetical protein